jgi:hypothetical protein
MSNRLLTTISAMVFIAGANVCFAHSGRTDSSGGHHDRKNGGYHYHGGGSSTSSTSSSFIRTTARETPRYEARSQPPNLRTTETRTLRTQVLGLSSLEVEQSESPDPPVVKKIESEVDVAKEAKARKLLDFATREYVAGKVEVAVKYGRRVITVYSRTAAATDAKQLLEEWKSAEPVRVWKSASGKFSTEATFLRVDRGTVYLKSKAGKTVGVEVKQLSPADQQYILNREGL